ncbi:MAG: cysteine hydrolase [Albidovulum sp.]|nr:cysteine hydrolase [Albidovulum sp.]
MHEVVIPKEIKEACIKRRGRLHVFDKLDSRSTALVVIDMQNSWLKPGMSPLEIPEARTIVDNINALARTIRKANGTVAWTQSTFPEDWTSKAYQGFGSQQWIKNAIHDTEVGSRGFQIYEKLDWREGDITVTKNRPSAFIQGSSKLESELRSRGCDTIVITGTLTNACCESSARDAAALGFRVVFVSDGTATRTDIEHNAALINLMQLVADVRTTEEVIQCLASRRAEIL